MKRICLLGATGSIGKNCVDIVTRFADRFSIQYLSAHRNIEELFALANQFRPEIAVLSGARADAFWRDKFGGIGVRIETGVDALAALAGQNDYDLLVNAVVGAAGLQPTLAAIRQNKNVAIANKETLVTAGELVTALSRKHQVSLFPIDSEHSALWQCLVGEDPDSIERLILTASGGPFRQLPASEFKDVTVEQALRHPNWAMGQKITIDSATLMNKGLEVIEAFWLFDVQLDNISVLIHPQSIIHSMIEFRDGSIKAQLGLPDMRLPIQYALSYPQRIPNDLPRMDFMQFNELTFMAPEPEKFRALNLAYHSLREAGTAPAVLNAANEEAVHAFLGKKIRFDQIPAFVEEALEKHDNHRELSYESVMQADGWARQFVRSQIE